MKRSLKCSLRDVIADAHCSLSEVHPLPLGGGGCFGWSSKGLLIWVLQEEQSELGRAGDKNLPDQKETASAIAQRPHGTSVRRTCVIT